MKKPLIFTCLAFLLFLSAVELSARGALLIWRVTQYGRTGFSQGNPLFEYDAHRVYRLRANVRSQFASKEVLTNSFHYRDSEIPVKKSPGTLRGIALGDSVTFGHGVDAGQAYPEQLEQLLNVSTGRKTEIINTGVPGYSAFQEYYELKDTLRFEPDFVIIQFVLNDVVEPYMVYKRYGGKGVDYHGIYDTNFADHWLTERSGFYYLMKKIYARIRFGAWSQEQISEKARRQEKQWDINAAAAPPADSDYEKAWVEYLNQLSRIVDLCREHSLKVVLMATPVDFQMTDLNKRYAQERLKAFAAGKNIHYLDLLEVLQQKAREELIQKHSLPSETEYESLIGNYRNEIGEIWSRYFLDYDHLTPYGHRFTAEILAKILSV